MKKIVTALVLLLFVLGIGNVSLADNGVQLKGTITKISGNQIIIKDSSGRELMVEGSIKGLKVGDLIQLKGEIFKVGSMRTELNAQDAEFLTKQCSIDRSDVNVIPQLEEKTRMKLMSWLDRKDCKLFAPFKVSREYFKSLRPKSQIPLAPAGWNVDYLTNKEFSQYAAIIESAPW